MRRIVLKTPLGRLFLAALVPIGAGAFASGIVAGDICQAYKTGSVGKAPGGAPPLVCA